MWIWKQLFVMVWVLTCVSALPPQAPVTPISCPQDCRCLTTAEGLHKATCTDLHTLYKYSVHQKHHNINIIELHNADIEELNGQLDKFTEVVSVDFSKNKISHIDKFLRNSKKLVHLNLSGNQIKKFSASQIPHSVSSLDLSYNLLHNMPSDLQTLSDLEHLQLEGNPLHCSCDNLKLLNHLKDNNVIIDDIICRAPDNLYGKIWNKLNVIEICDPSKQSTDIKIPLDDIMMGDQPAEDGSTIDNSLNDLDSVQHWESSDKNTDNDDDQTFIKISSTVKPDLDTDNLIVGSGDDAIDDLKTHEEMKLYSEDNTEMSSTDDPEISGDLGSGYMNFSMRSNVNSTNVALYDDDYGSGDGMDSTTATSTTEFAFFGPIKPYFDINEHFESSSHEPFEEPKIFQGVVDWGKDNKKDESTTVVEEKIEAELIPEVSGTKPTVDDDLLNQEYSEEESRHNVKSSVGTYVCIGILIAILVGLIGLAVLKSQIRKRRDHRMMRQQKKDVEKAGKEMVDMNKSLLGKPVSNINDPDKKVNGNYELVPTHEPKKKPENGINDKKGIEDSIQKSAAPKVMAENPNNNVPNAVPSANPQINVPETIDEPSHVDGPLDNGYDHDHGQPNGFHYPENSFLAPDYIPVYNPDSGRVRIKLTETPKPKTPVLVTRSRSNAGDIIITPASEQNSPIKSTT